VALPTGGAIFAIGVPKKFIRRIKCLVDRPAALIGAGPAKLAAAGNFCPGATAISARRKML
jgi:hypothetical protein